MKISRLNPLGPLPANKWDLTPRNWSGRVVRKEDQADLPIAYFGEQIGGLATVHYQSPSFGAQGFCLRPPCVILGGDSGLITGADPETLAALDAIGVLHAALPPKPEFGETVDDSYESQFHQGLPVWFNADEDRYELMALGQYAGARVYVIHGEQGVPIYWDENTDGFDSTVQDTSVCAVDCDDHREDPLCQELDLDFTIEIPHGATDCAMEDAGLYHNQEEAIDLLQEHIDENFDRYRLCAWFTEESEELTRGNYCSCVLLDETCIVTFSNIGDVSIGDNSAVIDKRRQKFNDLYTSVDNFTRDDGPISNEEILADILDFFGS